jgi:hypothetical protein
MLVVVNPRRNHAATVQRPNDMTLKQVREALALTVDSVGYSRKDECFVAKRSYFYRVQGGGSPDALAAAIQRAVPGANVVKAEDHFKQWPATSYFEVRFTVGAR